MDDYLVTEGSTNKDGNPRAMIDLRLRASRRQTELLDRYGLTAEARADWVSKLSGRSVNEEIRRRLEEVDRERERR